MSDDDSVTIEFEGEFPFDKDTMEAIYKYVQMRMSEDAEAALANFRTFTEKIVSDMREKSKEEYSGDELT